MLCISVAYTVVCCQYVCLSITFVYSVETNKHVFIFTIGQPHNSRFSIPNVMAIFRRGPPDEGVECRRGRQKLRFSANIWLHHVLSTVRPSSVIHAVAPHRGKLVTLIDGKRRRLLFAGGGRRSVYDKKPHRYVEDNRTEFSCTQW